jgi:WhiB family redox-sensing transcriptional regulator
MFDFTGASCLDKDPDMFFSDEEYRYDKKIVAQAKLICKGCPLKTQCLEFAMEGGYQGVWGGLTEADRTRRANGTEAINRSPEAHEKALNNLRSANKKQTAEASYKVIQKLKEVMKSMDVSEIPADTLELIEIRINNPELSWSEVGQRCSTPMSRFAVSGRFRRLMQDAIEKEKEKARKRSSKKN